MRHGVERLVGIREVADLFAVDISTIRRWERAGHLSSVRVGERGHRRFRQSEIERLLETQHSSEETVPAGGRSPA